MKNEDEVKLFEESEVEAHDEEDMGEQVEEKNQSEDEEMIDAAEELISTACNTPNLSCIDEAQSFIESAKHLIRCREQVIGEDIQLFSELSTCLTQATGTLSVLKQTLMADFKLLELRLRQTNDENFTRLRLKHQKLRNDAQELAQERL